MRIFLIFLLSISTLTSYAADQIIGTLTITNIPVTGDYITVNSDTRTWRTNVTAAATQISINTTNLGTCASNLYNQIAGNPFTGPLGLQRSGTNGIILRGTIGGSLSITADTNWATVTYSTNTVTSMTTVRVPLSSEPSTSTQTNVASYLVTGIQDYSTNTFTPRTGPMALIPGLAGYNNFAGSNYFTGGAAFTTASIADLTSSRITAPQISITPATTGGDLRAYDYPVTTAVTMTKPDTNGLLCYIYYTNWNATKAYAAVTNYPYASNLVNRAQGDLVWGQLAADNSWSAANTFASITNSTIYDSTLTRGTYSGTVTFLTNGVYYSPTLTSPGTTNLTARGTNNINGVTAYPRVATSSLANGNNAAVDFGSSTYARIDTGPTAAFAICGIAGGQDGRHLIIHNNTGQILTMSHDSGVDPTPANRIYTTTGADISGTNLIWQVIYDSGQSRWILFGQ